MKQEIQPDNLTATIPATTPGNGQNLMPHQMRAERDRLEREAEERHTWTPPQGGKVSKPPSASHYGDGKQKAAAYEMLAGESDGVRAGIKFQQFDYLWRCGHKGTQADALRDAEKNLYWAKELLGHEQAKETS